MSWRPISSTYLKPAVVTSAVGRRLALEDRVGRGGGAVEDAQHVGGGAPGQGQHLADRGDESGREIARRGGCLRHPERSGGRVGERDVGEGTADVDGERTGLGHGPGHCRPGRGPGKDAAPPANPRTVCYTSPSRLKRRGLVSPAPLCRLTTWNSKTTTRPSGSSARRTTRRSRPPTASSPASTTPTSTRGTRSASRRSARPTRSSPIPRSASATTRSGPTGSAMPRPAPAPRRVGDRRSRAGPVRAVADVRFTQEGDAGGFSDFFRTIFGGDLGGFRRGEPGGGRTDFEFSGFGTRGDPGGGMGRGNDVEAAIELTLEEAFNGARKTIALELDEPCPQCGGSGNVKRPPLPALPRQRLDQGHPQPRREDPGRRGHRVAGAGGRRKGRAAGAAIGSDRGRSLPARDGGPRRPLRAQGRRPAPGAAAAGAGGRARAARSRCRPSRARSR